ncbi:MAG: oligosaccharide flippase family protein [Clostridia bacterium]|nr:oligosaccharide flippase family protein [Clostridia bacterium]
MMKNAILLGFSGFCAKSFDFIFRAFYSRSLGQEGMGLLSLGFGIHGVMLTVSTAGLGVAVSKTVSAYLVKKDYGAVRESMNLALYAVISLSFFVILLTFFGAEWMAKNILGDVRVATSLCCLAPSILFMGISYCLKGYFYARRRVCIPASSEFLEQAVKGCLISLFLQLFLKKGIEYGCTAVFLGITLGELSSCFYLLLFYLRERGELSSQTTETGIGRELFKISFPAMLTSLTGSVLRMQEEVWIISALKRYGMSHGEAVSNLGVLHGMVMPMLVFPLTLIGSVTTLLVPEISRADALTDRKRLRNMTRRIYSFGLLAGGAVLLLFQVFPVEISRIIYQDVTIVPMVRTLSLLCPLMFLDSLSCAILNGMGKQFSMLCYSLLDSLLRLAGISLFVSSFGMGAMEGIVVFSNLFTCALTVRKVLKRQGIFSKQKCQKIKRRCS